MISHHTNTELPDQFLPWIMSVGRCSAGACVDLLIHQTQFSTIITFFSSWRMLCSFDEEGAINYLQVRRPVLCCKLVFQRNFFPKVDTLHVATKKEKKNKTHTSCALSPQRISWRTHTKPMWLKELAIRSYKEYIIMYILQLHVDWLTLNDLE